jgi:hypothetical protein
MSSLSIRGVDPQLAAILKEQAKKSQKSINQFVLETLRQHVGLMKEKRFTREYDDLDNLFGRWSDEEYADIQGKIDAERQIDEELWG